MSKPLINVPASVTERLYQAERECDKEAVYVGEDGEMVLSMLTTKTELGAYRKFYKLEKDCTGETEEMSVEHVGIAYLVLPSPDDINDYGDEFEWFMTLEKPIERPYVEVWVYSPEL